MKKVEFSIDVGFGPSCVRKVTETFDDDVTQEELNEYAEELVWDYISVSFKEV